jgi:hypothetical protein
MAENDFTTANAKNGIPGQAIIDAGLNVFALQLLLESFTEIAGGNTEPVEFTYLGVNVRLQIAAPADAGEAR